MQQLRLSFGLDKEFIRTYLERSIRKPVSLTITDNATSMISCRNRGDTLILRLHRMFLTAGFDVLDEIAIFIKKGKKKTPLIRGHINDNEDLIRRERCRSIALRTRGKRHDLRDLFDAINEEYFGGGINAVITWGAKGPRRYARTRTLGSYSSDDDTIRINPVLDSGRVPLYFLEFVMYHEMLHADMGIQQNENRRSLHSKEFRRRERLFKYYERAMKWERERY